jgi:hypothetical protein
MKNKDKTIFKASVILATVIFGGLLFFLYRDYSLVMVVLFIVYTLVSGVIIWYFGHVLYLPRVTEINDSYIEYEDAKNHKMRIDWSEIIKINKNIPLNDIDQFSELHYFITDKNERKILFINKTKEVKNILTKMTDSSEKGQLITKKINQYSIKTNFKN